MSKRLVFSILFIIAAIGASKSGFSDETPLSRIAFGSCLRQEKAQPVWNAIRKVEPGLFIFVGNAVYADTDDPLVLRAAYGRLSGNAAFQNFRSTCALVGVWDDHDYGEIDAGADFPMKEMSQQVFLDFYGVPADSPRRSRPGIYDAPVFGPIGKRVQVILLDTRFNRSPLRRDERKLFPPRPYLSNTDLNATLLGRTQWNWLRAQLKVPAEVRLIVTSLQLLATEQQDEKWANFPLERQKLLEMLDELNVTNAVILSGGRSFAEISKEDVGPGVPLYDVTSGSLNDSRRPAVSERNSRRVGSFYDGNNFGLLTIDWEGPSPRVAVEIRDEDGHIRLQQDVIHGQ